MRFLVGGEAASVAKAQSVFDVLGSETIYLGPSGSGSMLKLINNFLCGVQVAALAEAMVAIERSGLDVEAAFRLIGTGAPGSPLVNAVGDRMIQRVYTPQFLIPLMAKDLGYAEFDFTIRQNYKIISSTKKPHALLYMWLINLIFLQFSISIQLIQHN